MDKTKTAQSERLLFVGDTAPACSFDLGPRFRRFCAAHKVRVFNLEGSFSWLVKPALKAGPHLLLKRQHFGPIQECFNVAVLANNHAMDYGVEGLDTTLLHCRKVGIKTVGAGLNLAAALKPLDIGSVRIIAVAEHEFGAAATDRAGVATVDSPLEIYHSITEGCRSGKFVIVVAHGGAEFISVPPPYLRARYKLWVEYGASLVIGNHPHIVQGGETYKGGMIFYSLGNFAFFLDSMRGRPGTEWSIAVSVDPTDNNIRIVPVSSKDGVVEIADRPEYERQFERLCGLIQSEHYADHYAHIARELYAKRYKRMVANDERDAALVLHYLRCDAHRHLLQTALSMQTGEAESLAAAELQQTPARVADCFT